MFRFIFVFLSPKGESCQSKNKLAKSVFLYCLCGLHTSRAKHVAALFLRLGLPSTLIRHNNGAFQTGRPLQTAENKIKCWLLRYSCDFPDRFFLKYKCKVASDYWVSKFSRRSVDGKHSVRFQRESSLRSVDGPWWIGWQLISFPDLFVHKRSGNEIGWQPLCVLCVCSDELV